MLYLYICASVTTLLIHSIYAYEPDPVTPKAQKNIAVEEPDPVTPGTPVPDPAFDAFANFVPTRPNTRQQKRRRLLGWVGNFLKKKACPVAKDVIRAGLKLAKLDSLPWDIVSQVLDEVLKMG